MAKARYSKTLDGGTGSGELPQRIQLPFIKQSEVPFVVPRYASILVRTIEDGVGMKDLDHLQEDLEKLLSNSAVRSRLLRSEVDAIEQIEDYKDNKNGKSFKKKSIKRRRLDERSCTKYKEFRYASRIIKTKHNIPFNHLTSELVPKSETPKVNFPKNDTSDKFWLSIDPFCADVSKDDLAFVDELIHECSQGVDIKINQLGDHYTLEWSHDLLTHDTNGIRSAISKPHNEVKNGIIIECSPLAQSTSAALSKKLKPHDYCVTKFSHNNKNGICLDRRLQNIFIEQDILDIDDLPRHEQSNDDLLIEIKKCIQELQTVNKKNAEQLTRLRKKVVKDLERQEVKEALAKVDNQVMEVYNKILTAKQKHSAQMEHEPFEHLIPKLDLSEYHQEAQRVIDEQVLLHKELIELNNMTGYY